MMSHSEDSITTFDSQVLVTNAAVNYHGAPCGAFNQLTIAFDLNRGIRLSTGP